MPESAASRNLLVNIDNMSFTYAARKIFNGLSLSVEKGKVTAIMGPSGTGKTTLLRLIGGELRPDSGTVEVFGQDVASISRTELYKQRSRMGILFQQGALFTDLNVLENVSFPLCQHTKLSKTMIRDLALLRLESVGLRGVADLMVHELSGGMARRVALARSTIMDPELMLYDEPFTGQDPISKAVLVQLISKLNQALGLSTVIVSHDIAETLAIADFVYIISEGGVVASGTPEQLQAKIDSDPVLHQFLRGEADGPVPFSYPALVIADDLNIKRETIV
jgi:phospholipid/cholesterol/gamma-HCH transport system ATP-binding protein